jgi:(S)-citramalyl-CoA lyase
MSSSSDPRRRPRRSILFCPGSRPDRFGKALAAGADAVCLDLEDGVAPARREEARQAVGAWLRDRAPRATGPELVLRVNAPGSVDGERDLALLRALPGDRRPRLLMVPKVDDPQELGELLEALEGRRADGDGGGDQGGDVAEGDASAGGASAGEAPWLLPLVETALGLHRVESLALSGLPLAGLVFGGMDLAAELGARFEWEPLLQARSRIVHAAALAGVGAIDVPWAPLDDPEGLRVETSRAARLGFQGKLAIHPAQIPHIHAALAPDPTEVEAARRILEAATLSHEGVQVVDGRMVDRPLVLGAERVLARAGEPIPGASP